MLHQMQALAQKQVVEYSLTKQQFLVFFLLLVVFLFLSELVNAPILTTCNTLAVHLYCKTNAIGMDFDWRIFW